MVAGIEEGRAASKSHPIFFLCPSKKFLLISFKIQLLEYFPQNQKEQRQNKMVTTEI
jgi:hypothetical protein